MTSVSAWAYVTELSPCHGQLHGLFIPRRRLISGGIDGILCVWDVANGEAIYKLSIGREIICLLWHPSQHTKVFCGCADGALILDITTSIACEILTGSKDPVYALDYNVTTRLLAIAAGNKVHVAKEAREKDGMSLHAIGNSVASKVFKQEVSESDNIPLPVAFIRGGREVVCSSLCSDVNIWDVDSTIPFQALGHANTPVNTISAYDGYTYSLLACAMAGRGKPVIRIWMAPRPRWFSTFFVHFHLESPHGPGHEIVSQEKAISNDRNAVFYGMICVMAILFVSALAFTWSWHTSYFSSIGPDMSHALRFIRSQFVDMFSSR
ncbi:hypothetical protein EWM64_g936 [Hericium alpestre]|uniref:Uncharacterized protein n=1 Tax=Hericium alpestre TaxID=135208 RepID=A0A4Z0ABT3_9AGAM|nr:hypothetical protein EWM64_g936 [Hericium alpestre]